MQLQPARAADAAALTDLALRSKGHWGYDSDFLDACRRELTLRPDDVAARRATVAVDGTGRLVGFYTLDGEPPEGEVGMLFVEPDRIGTGLGRLLWSDMTGRAESMGFQSLLIQADPGAAPFYEAMGATVIGSRPSGSVPGRHLPLLEYRVPGTELSG